MRNLIAFPLLALAVILQTAIVSQIRLVAGHADLLLLTLSAWALQKNVRSAWLWGVVAATLTGFVSHLDWYIYAIGYAGALFIAQVLQRRIWQAPLLAMFSVTFAGTLWMQFLSFAYLRVLGTPLSLSNALGLVTLPSLLLNMLFSIPTYVILRDLARWVYPQEEYE